MLKQVAQVERPVGLKVVHDSHIKSRVSTDPCLSLWLRF